MAKPDLVVVANIRHGVMKDGKNVVTEYTVGDTISMDDMSEEEVKSLITCQAVVDRSGEMQALQAIPFVDKQTAERDELLAAAGMPVLVDTSNPMNHGQNPGPKASPVDLAKENAELREKLAAASVQSTENAQRSSQEENKAISKSPIGSTKK